MKAGASTACLYPMVLEKAFLSLAQAGVKTTEIFVNSHCELTGTFKNEMLAIQNEYGIEVVSVHPFTCGIEPMMLFTAYERRVADMLDYFKRFFEYMNDFGAKYFVLHGNKNQNVIEDKMYFDRFARLQDAADSSGVCVVQENVSRCTGGSLDFLVKMKNALGERACFVLDLKQAHRAGNDPTEMVKALGKNIKHIHFSDCGKAGDCLKFGFGEYDNEAFFAALKEQEYSGSVILELYRNGFGEVAELSENCNEMQKYLNKFD